MMRDDEFVPRLGRSPWRDRPARLPYATRILREIARAGGDGRRRTRSHFSGSRLGRGAGVGRVLHSRDPYAGFRARHVVIKTRIIRLAGRGLGSARTHLRYLERDGVTRDGAPGQLYGATDERADGKAFLARSEGDRHQFRFIVSPEDGVEYDDLKPLTRRLMQQLERDLGTRLEWIAADHYNTGHPHTHIVLRGKAEDGKDLIIARDYITHGMRQRAGDLVSLDLGPRRDADIKERLRQDIHQSRFTALDRQLVGLADDEGLLSLDARGASAAEREMRACHRARLGTLHRLGLAAPVAPHRWRLSPDLAPILRRLGHRQASIETMHRAMAEQGTPRAWSTYALYDPEDPRAARLVGRVAASGIADELGERRYLVLDAIDGRTHFVEIGHRTGAPALGSTVAIEPHRPGVLPYDRTIAEIAAAHGGAYTVDRHLRHDPGCSMARAAAHRRRLETLARHRLVSRTDDGVWRVPADYLDRVARFERARRTLAAIELLSPSPPHRLAAVDAATWLDRTLLSGPPPALRDAGFGGEVSGALEQRRRWLIEQRLAEQTGYETVYARNVLATLTQRELRRAAAELAEELRLPYAESAPGELVQGAYRRRLDLISGRFVVVERAGTFTLVRWRPAFERPAGQTIGIGAMGHGHSGAWTGGRRRIRSIS